MYAVLPRVMAGLVIDSEPVFSLIIEFAQLARRWLVTMMRRIRGWYNQIKRVAEEMILLIGEIMHWNYSKGLMFLKINLQFNGFQRQCCSLEKARICLMLGVSHKGIENINGMWLLWDGWDEQKREQ